MRGFSYTCSLATSPSTEIVADSHANPSMRICTWHGSVSSSARPCLRYGGYSKPNSSKWAFLNCVAVSPGDMHYSTRGRIPVQLRACRGRQTGHFGGNAGKHRLLAATLMTRIDYLLLFIVEMMNTFYVLCRGRLGQGAWLCSIGRGNTIHFCVVDSDRNSKTDISQ